MVTHVKRTTFLICMAILVVLLILLALWVTDQLIKHLDAKMPI